ncbi:MAG: nitrogen fixation protein NifQ [Magnetospiraceae bacterium]
MSVVTQSLRNHGPADARRAVAADLLARGRGVPNDRFMAQMIASWSLGEGMLRGYMGLPAGQFRRMLRHAFPGARFSAAPGGPLPRPLERMEELDDLRSLLLAHRAKRDPAEFWIAELICAGCMGSDHLWQDLGLWARADLTRMIEYNFPRLGRRNRKNMKWKKFLYKQLCEAHGVFICRSPTCETCVDYDYCFGPED